MEPISNVDRLVLLLRRRLQERDRLKGKDAARAASASTTAPGGLAAAQALALEDIDERQLRRALVQGLLGDQLGRGLVNEARFQQVVERVVQALETDETSRFLLDRVVHDLRGAGR